MGIAVLPTPFTCGICGAAVRNHKIQIVDDVNKFDGHIACSDSTRSQLVIPCFDRNGELLGVLDIDSDQPTFFTKQDADDLDQLTLDLFMDERS